MHIDLSWNVFEKDILRFLGGALLGLKSVDLSHNEMQGPLSSKGAYIYFKISKNFQFKIFFTKNTMTKLKQN